VEGPDVGARREGRRRDWPTTAWVLLVVCLGGVLAGVVVRVWLLVHQPLTGDEAIAALMARQIRHGHLYSFYWGGAYGGAEPYLVAAVTSVFGSDAVAVNLSATLLTAVSTVLMWSLVRSLVPPAARWIAYPAAVMFWVWPEASLWNSTRESGFRCVTMLAGLACLKLALRLTSSGSWGDAAGLGLAIGVGWWSSPEIVYFLIPVAPIVAAAVYRQEHNGRPSRAGVLLLSILSCAGLGSLPWILTNVRSGFASLSMTASPVYQSSTYLHRLGTAFGKTMPMMLGLRTSPGGAWIGGDLGRPLYGVVVAAVIAACAWSIFRVRTLLPLAAVAMGCVAFPFIYAVFPATVYWTEGQYGVFVVPLVVLVVFASLGFLSLAATGRRVRPPTTSWTAALILIVGVASTVVCFNDAWLQAPTPLYSSQIAQPSFLAGWGTDPSRTAAVTARLAESIGIKYAYADYWTAYVLDLFGGGRLIVSDVHNDRWVPEYRAVWAASDPAWLFVHPGSLSAAQHAFPRARIGPDNYSEAAFSEALTKLGISYQIIRLGVLDAMLPAARVTPSQVGMPLPEHV
jgi:hypothetical protein